MEHSVLVAFEDNGWRVYVDGVSKPGEWFSKTELIYAKHQARLYVKQYQLNEYRIIDMHRYEEIVKVYYDNE